MWNQHVLTDPELIQKHRKASWMAGKGPASRGGKLDVMALVFRLFVISARVCYSSALWCLADYINTQELLKIDHVYMKAVGNAINLITWWVTHSVCFGMLKQKQLAILGAAASLSFPVVTQWGNQAVANK